MPVFAVTYTYDDRTELRMQTRPTHRAFLSSLYDREFLLVAGAWGDDGEPGALLVARADSAEDVVATLDTDPYRKAGVIAHRDIRLWNQTFSPWEG